MDENIDYVILEIIRTQKTKVLGEDYMNNRGLVIFNFQIEKKPYKLSRSLVVREPFWGDIVYPVKLTEEGVKSEDSRTSRMFLEYKDKKRVLRLPSEWVDKLEPTPVCYKKYSSFFRQYN